jgi:hypothetical protein
MRGQRNRWTGWLRAACAVAFAYLLLIQFALAPLAMLRAHAAASTGQNMVLCIDGHASDSQDQPGAGHDCADCCLNRVVTAPLPTPSPSQPVITGTAPLSDGTGWPAIAPRGPPKEAWSDHKTQRGPPARA